MHLAVALGLVIAYLALSINTYLETQALGRFTLGYGRLGPTEARLALLGLLAAVALGAHVAVPLLGTTLTLLDVATGGAAVAMIVAGAVRAAGNLRTLARREPYPAA
jgi:archaetidylinositol phosphate synthase